VLENSENLKYDHVLFYDMSNFNVHIGAGLVTALLVAFLLQNFFGISMLVITFGVILAVTAAGFPDIDHEKSMPRKIMRSIVPGIVIFLVIYYFFANHMWDAPVLNMIILFGAAALFVFTYERFIPQHRGATHKIPGLAFVVAISVIAAFFLGFSFISAVVLVVFSIIGFSTHVLLDHL